MDQVFYNLVFFHNSTPTLSEHRCYVLCKSWKLYLNVMWNPLYSMSQNMITSNQYRNIFVNLGDTATPDIPLMKAQSPVSKY